MIKDELYDWLKELKKEPNDSFSNVIERLLGKTVIRKAKEQTIKKESEKIANGVENIKFINKKQKPKKQNNKDIIKVSGSDINGYIERIKEQNKQLKGNE